MLPGWSVDEGGAVHAVLPPGRPVPAKAQAFVDWVAAAFAPVPPLVASGVIGHGCPSIQDGAARQLYQDGHALANGRAPGPAHRPRCTKAFSGWLGCNAVSPLPRLCKNPEQEMAPARAAVR